MRKEGKKSQHEAVHREIIDVLAKITRIDASDIKENVLIKEELGIDSLMGIEIIAKVEKYFNIHLEESLLLEIDRVGDFIGLVESKIK